MIDICIVVALSENRVIGVDNTLPWHLPEDLKYFKKITMGHPIVMGRKTFESIGRPLPGRINIVVTTQQQWCAENVVVVHSLSQGLEAAKNHAKSQGLSQAMLIGGAQLYKQALPMCTRLYLTEVHAEIDGDAYFPEFDRNEWRQISSQRHGSDERNPYAYSFTVLEKKM